MMTPKTAHHSTYDPSHHPSNDPSQPLSQPLSDHPSVHDINIGGNHGISYDIEKQLTKQVLAKQILAKQILTEQILTKRKSADQKSAKRALKGKTSPSGPPIRHKRNTWIGGIDEVGRGALAGPVVVAIVILDPKYIHPLINDSKRILPATREMLAAYIKTHARAYATAAISPQIIDKINILAATRLAIRRAYAKITRKPHYLLIDGVHLENLPHWHRYPPKHYALPTKEYSIVKGDTLSYSIAAASILAKVTRDRTMRAYHNRHHPYQIYNFHANKGYGVPEHVKALKKHGLSPIHRKTFMPHALRTGT